MNEDILKWVKCNNCKDVCLIFYKDGVYDFVYFDKGKVCIGIFKDGMYCCYGINCCGVMYLEDFMSLW